MLLLASTALANLLTDPDHSAATHHGHGVGGDEEGNHHGADGAGHAEQVQHHLPKGPRRTVLHRNGKKVGLKPSEFVVKTVCLEYFSICLLCELCACMRALL